MKLCFPAHLTDLPPNPAAKAANILRNGAGALYSHLLL